jgi:hypothetical protein
MGGVRKGMEKRVEKRKGGGVGHLGATSLELGDDGRVVALVLGVDVRLLQHQAHRHGVLRVDAGGLAVHVVVPRRVLLVRLEHLFTCEHKKEREK